MAPNAAANRPGLSYDGIRSLDHLEAGVCAGSKRLSSPDRIRLHVPCSKIRHHYDLVCAWTVIFITSGTTGAAFTDFAIRGFR
jgi:hypothetical protein